MKRKIFDLVLWIWRIISMVFILVMFLLLFGFGYVIKDVIYFEGDLVLGVGQLMKILVDEVSKFVVLVDDGKI